MLSRFQFLKKITTSCFVSYRATMVVGSIALLGRLACRFGGSRCSTIVVSTEVADGKRFAVHTWTPEDVGIHRTSLVRSRIHHLKFKAFLCNGSSSYSFIACPVSPGQSTTSGPKFLEAELRAKGGRSLEPWRWTWSVDPDREKDSNRRRRGGRAEGCGVTADDCVYRCGGC